MTGCPNPPRALNLALVGTAIVALAAGPFFTLISEIFISLVTDIPFGAAQTDGPQSFPSLLMESSFYGLIVAVPIASINAVAVGLLARRGWDSSVWAAISGTVVGLPFGIYASWITTGGLVVEFGRVDLQYMLVLSSFYVVTSLTLALCYWWIATRPLRRWRLRMESGKDAIRAME
jgi:hypothetical protein